MFGYFKKILILLAVVAVLFATSGFSVYHHHCSCSAMAETSMLIKKFDCSHFNDNDTPCSTSTQEEPRCCQTSDIIPEPVEGSSKDDCCSTTQDFIKITIDLKVDHYRPTIQLYSTLLSFVSIEDNTNNTENFTGFQKTEAPPPRPGKDILISHHQLKLDIPLA